MNGSVPVRRSPLTSESSPLPTETLRRLVEKGDFRSDLYYRLNVLPLQIPPLRSRPEDITVLAEFFLKRFARETNKHVTGFSDEAMEALLSYNWPGNVRELENAVERSVVITRHERVMPEDLLLHGTAGTADATFQGKNLKDSINLFKRQFIRQALDRHGWNHTETAKELQIQRSYLSKLVKDLKIKSTKGDSSP